MDEIRSRDEEAVSASGRFILLASVFIVAACGLVYELVAGAVSSYILGDAITQFSLVIGVFLCAMGIGAYAAKFIRRRLLNRFIEIEIWVGLVGGLSSLCMFAVSAYAAPVFEVFFYLLCAIIGILIGIEIPLLVRILKQDQGVSEALSHVLALDYVGALAGSVLFPLVILPFLGLSRSSMVFGLMNLAVAGAGLTLLGPGRGWLAAQLVTALMVLLILFGFSNRMVGFLEDLLYQDSIVLARTTPYQRIVMTRWRDDIRLYLNGHIQFSSVDEARYHESLVLPALQSHPAARRVLILGGGDGMAAREVLKYKQVDALWVVDIDPAMTHLAQTRPELLALNRGALNDERVHVVNQDAFSYLAQTEAFFDVIIIDLPDPNTQAMCKLYSKAFYSLCRRRLSARGVVVTQATSPFYAPEAFWCIHRTLQAAGNPETGEFEVQALHVNVPSFGEWGFVLAAKSRLDPAGLRLSVPTRFLTEQSLRALFVFGKDLQPVSGIAINQLQRPVLHTYYQRGWARFNE